MSIRSILLAVFGLTLSGCAVSDDGRYYGGYYGGGYSVQHYEVYPAYPVSPRYRVYRYDDDRRGDWHRDRYQERRHHHYAPGYDGRYGWQGKYGRDDRRRHEQRGHDHARPVPHSRDYRQSRDDDRKDYRAFGRSQSLSRPEQNFSLKRQQIQRQDQSRHEQRRAQGGRSWDRRD